MMRETRRPKTKGSQKYGDITLPIPGFGPATLKQSILSLMRHTPPYHMLAGASISQSDNGNEDLLMTMITANFFIRFYSPAE